MDRPQAKKLKWEILSVEPDPEHRGRTFISIKFSGKKESWIQGFSLIPPERPLSPEEFIIQVKKQFVIAPPVDPFQYLKDAKGQQFDISLDAELAGAE